MGYAAARDQPRRQFAGHLDALAICERCDRLIPTVQDRRAQNAGQRISIKRRALHLPHLLFYDH